MLDRIEVFKAGKHRALNGQVYEFSEADVAGIAAAYDPALQSGPIVLGHPKTDDPAWGWVKGLTVENGRLVAETEKVDAAFAEGVEAGRYRYVSASFYPPQDPANPKPGAWYLRHVGFLGAQPPAVKGLHPAFSEEPGDGLVAFAAVDGGLLRDLFRRFRDWLIEDRGLDVADQVLPSWYIDNIELEPTASFAESGSAPPVGAASETATVGDVITVGAAEDAAIAQRAAELDAREAELRQREVAFAEGQRQRARDEDGAFLDGLVEAGRLPPAHRERVAAIFARLDGDQTVAFAEADADPRAELRQLLEGLGTSIQFAEFAAGDGFTGEVDAGALAARASDLVAAANARGETLSYADAVRRSRNP